MNIGRKPEVKTVKASKSKTAGKVSEEFWELQLYVAGRTPKSKIALANLDKICKGHIEGKYHIEVIDLLKNPKVAKGEQILAVPTLVKKQPGSLRKIIGDFTDTERVLAGLDLRPSS